MMNTDVNISVERRILSININGLPFFFNKLSATKDDKTYTIIAYLYLKYICESEEEKNRLKNIYIHNELVYQKELGEKYNPDDLFKNSKKSEEEREEKNELTDVKEESFFKKIINRIRNLFVKK